MGYSDVTFPGGVCRCRFAYKDERKFKLYLTIILLLGAVACRFSFTTGDGVCWYVCRGEEVGHERRDPGVSLASPKAFGVIGIGVRMTIHDHGK